MKCLSMKAAIATDAWRCHLRASLAASSRFNADAALMARLPYRSMKTQLSTASKRQQLKSTMMTHIALADEAAVDYIVK